MSAILPMFKRPDIKSDLLFHPKVPIADKNNVAPGHAERVIGICLCLDDHLVELHGFMSDVAH